MAFPWLINGGDPNYLPTGMILQVWVLPTPRSNHIKGRNIDSIFILVKLARDLTRVLGPQMVAFLREMPLFQGKSGLVKYYDLARFIPTLFSQKTRFFFNVFEAFFSETSAKQHIHIHSLFVYSLYIYVNNIDMYFI